MTSVGPYIPTEQECGAAWRDLLNLTSIEQARNTDHRFMGSHVRGWCFVCEQHQHAAVHGPIHFVARGEFACDPGGEGGITAPLSQRTRRPDQVSCPGCVVVLQAEACLAAA